MTRQPRALCFLFLLASQVFSQLKMSSSCLLVSVPNQKRDTSADSIRFLKQETACTKNDLAQCYEFELPSDLLVGTLDSLMVCIVKL